MNVDDRIDAILDNLIKSGSDINYIKELKDKSASETSKDYDLKEVLNNIALDIENITKEFLDKKNEFDTSFITGISTGIYLPDYSGDGTYKYTLVGGDVSRYHDGKVDFNTKFDVASITKLYTLILVFKLEELGLIDLNIKVSDLNPEFQNMGDFTLNDLIRLHGELRTDGRVDDAKSYEEALAKFKTLYLYSDDRTKNKYNDLGAMLIADTLEKVISFALGKNMKFDEIMNEFLFKPLYIKNSVFTPGIINVSGNANDMGLPHDPKSRLLGGVTGHAGIFTDSESMYHLADGVFNKEYLNQEHIDRLGEHTFNGSSKGNLGVYVKTPNGYADSYTPSEFSTGSFSHQGWTGSVATFDPNNKIHNNILVNAIDLDTKEGHLKNNKPLGFRKEFGAYQSELTKRIMLMYVVKKYYNKYFNVKEDIEEAKMIM